MIASLWSNRSLVIELVKRDIASRYKASVFGLLWSFVTPLFMLLIYTFVFGFVFRTRWYPSDETVSTWEFAAILFCGLTVFNIVAETLSRSPSSITDHPNYVKRIVFPLEVLPVTVLASALVNGAISFVLLVGFFGIMAGTVHWTVLYLPLVLVPLALMALGAGWFLASLGVFMRDVIHLVPMAVSALLFLSPIFYPVSAVPEQFRVVFAFNPLAYVIEDARNVLLLGRGPDWRWLWFGSSLGALVAVCGLWWFQRTKKGFADVL